MENKDKELKNESFTDSSTEKSEFSDVTTSAFSSSVEEPKELENNATTTSSFESVEDYSTSTVEGDTASTENTFGSIEEESVSTPNTFGSVPSNNSFDNIDTNSFGNSNFGNSNTVNEFPVDEGNYTVTLLLALFLGVFGVHRFYNKKIGTGIAMLLTCGGFGIWTLVDIIIIMTGNFKNKDGAKLKWKESSFIKNPGNIVAIIVLVLNIIYLIFTTVYTVDYIFDNGNDILLDDYLETDEYNDDHSTSDYTTVTDTVEEATSEAQFYVDYMDFSKVELVDQLVGVGYSEKNALEAVENITVDWNNEAVDFANSYYSMGYTKEEIIVELQNSGYTEENIAAASAELDALVG